MMPFYDDAADDEERLGPIFSSFSTLREQIERFVTLNIAWSVQLLPGLAALAFQEWPAGLRAGLVMYSAVALPPASAAVYALVARACDGDQIDLPNSREALVALAAPSMRSLAPLYAALLALVLLAAWSGSGPTLLSVVLRLGLLLALLCATYWGPLLADDPRRSPLALLRGSIRLTLRYPWPTLLTFGVVLIASALAAISVGGLFLIVFVLVALLQTRLYLEVKGGMQRTRMGHKL